MGAAADYQARADRVAREALESPTRRQPLAAYRRELRHVQTELWTTQQRIRLAYLRRRIRAAGTWPRPWAVWSRVWLRYAEGATLAPYRVVARQVDAHLARIDGACALLAGQPATNGAAHSAQTTGRTS